MRGRDRYRELGALMLLLAACGGSGNDPNSGHAQITQVCSAGDRRVCDCGGRAGEQACSESGEGYEPCLCEVAAPDGGVPGMGDSPPGGCGPCDGCCRGTTCVPLENESEAACGRRGQACVGCDRGGVCDTATGTCATPTEGACNAATCPDGCCSPSGCVTSPSWAQCGHKGSTCGTCALGGSVCESNGSCQQALVDGSEYFYLSVRFIDVLAETPAGHDWDPLVFGHTAPDPMVCARYIDSATGLEHRGCTTPCNDTASCGFSVADGLLRYCYEQVTCTLCSSPKTVCDPVLFRGSALVEGSVEVTVDDYDSNNGDDRIAQSTLPPLPRLEGTTLSTNAFGSVVQLQYDVLYELP
jgi:hypothetical protein